MVLKNWLIYISVLALAAVGTTTALATGNDQSGQYYLVVSPQVEAQFESAWQDIQAAKANGTEITEEMYQRYFELEAQVYPERRVNEREGNLDQGFDACPGLLITPLTDPMDWVDYGQTYNYTDNCTSPRCRQGKDIVFRLEVAVEDRYVISTCASGFDTWLCLYNTTCCTGAPILQNDDNPAVCGPRTVRAAINACLTAGTYYIVLDGFNRAAQGHYQLRISSDVGGCTPTNPPECPPSNSRHVERFESEAACEAGDTITCPARICGDIGQLGDIDAFYFVINQCAIVTLSAFANASPGSYAFGDGLNPYLQLWPSPDCEAVVDENYNFNNADGQNQIYGTDSRIITQCLRPGGYWVELGGGSGEVGATGPYEFWFDCTPCPPPVPISPSQTYDFEDETVCLDWPDGAPGTTFYVWRRVCDGCEENCWTQIATPHVSQYCDELNMEFEVLYVVYANPCGFPTMSCGRILQDRRGR